MVKKYVFSKLGEEVMKNVTFKTILVKKGCNKKTFTEKEIDEVYQQLKAQGFKANDINMNVMGLTNDFCIKWWNNDALYDTTDYYNGHVHDPSKYDAYEYIKVTIKVRH
jgi:hypothetical protein